MPNIAAFVKYNGAFGRVHLADSTASAECKFGTMQFTIAGQKCVQTVGVLNLNTQFDMILGDDWFNEYRAVLNYDAGSNPKVDARCVTFKVSWQ